MVYVILLLLALSEERELTFVPNSKKGFLIW
jgi:hypothetical protein